MPEDTDLDPIQYQCRHIKPDGHRCGSPSLRDQNFCFYHRTARRCGPRQPQVQTATARKASTFDLPSPADLADRSGIQLAVALLLHKIAHNEIDPRRAGLLLYGLQIATMALPKPAKDTKKSRMDPLPVEDITEDPLHGPLAPPCELGENDPKSVLTTWVDAWRIKEKEIHANLEKEVKAHKAKEREAAKAAQEAAAAAQPSRTTTHMTSPQITLQPTPTHPQPKATHLQTNQSQPSKPKPRPKPPQPPTEPAAAKPKNNNAANPNPQPAANPLTR